MRVKTGTTRRRRHKKILARTKGYRMTKNRLYRVAHEAFMHAGQYAVAHRRRRPSQFRRLWITRLNAAVAEHGLKYKTFIHLLKTKNIALNRKTLSELAINEPDAFAKVVDFVKSK